MNSTYPSQAAGRARARRHNRGHMNIRQSVAMGFLIRFIACMAAVLSLSVLAAIAWDGSDQAARPPTPPAASST